VSVHFMLDALNVIPSKVTPLLAAFVRSLHSGNLLFSSGHLANVGGKRTLAIDLMGTLKVALGDLNQINHIAKLTVLVNNSPSFTEALVGGQRCFRTLAQLLEGIGNTFVAPLGAGCKSRPPDDEVHSHSDLSGPERFPSRKRNEGCKWVGNLVLRRVMSL
jgi:hypothetical protein